MVFNPCFSGLNRNRSRSGSISALPMGHLGPLILFHSRDFLHHLPHSPPTFLKNIHYIIAVNLVLKCYPGCPNHQSQEFLSYDDKVIGIISLAFCSLPGTAKFFTHITITTKSIFYSIDHNVAFFIYSTQCLQMSKENRSTTITGNG